MCYYVDVVTFDDEELILAFMGTEDDSILVVGNTQNVVASALLKEFYHFHLDELEACLGKIQRLSVREKGDDEVVVLRDFWAATFASFLAKSFPGEGNRIQNVIGQVQDRLWFSLDIPKTIMYMVIKPEPKILVVFSKQQAGLILQEPYYQTDFEARISLMDKISTADLPEKSDELTVWCEGCIAELLISIFLVAYCYVKSPGEYVQPYPWRYNPQNN